MFRARIPGKFYDRIIETINAWRLYTKILSSPFTKLQMIAFSKSKKTYIHASSALNVHNQST